MVNKDGRVSALAMPGLVHLEGGMPILFEGHCLGAVGVSPALNRSDDAAIAEVGIKALLG